MNLPISTINVDSGLSWEQNLNASLTLIDTHTHQSGSGIQIQPGGLNINTDLTFNSNSAVSLFGTNYISQNASLSSAYKGYVYQVGVDLYWNNGNGAAVQLTNGTSIVGTAGSISGLASPASASYGSSTFVWKSTATAPAKMDAGTVILRSMTTPFNAITITPPAAISGSSWPLVLPTIPASKSFLTIDISGNIASDILTNGLTTANLSASAGIVGTQIAATTIAGSNLINNTITATQIANNTVTATQIANNTITATQLANSAVGTAQLLDGGVTQVKRAAATFGTNTTTGFNTTVQGAPITLSCSGRPLLISWGTTTGLTPADWFATANGATISLYMDATPIATLVNATDSSLWQPSNSPAQPYQTTYVPSVGSHTFCFLTSAGGVAAGSTTLFLTIVEL